MKVAVRGEGTLGGKTLVGDAGTLEGDGGTLVGDEEVEPGRMHGGGAPAIRNTRPAGAQKPPRSVDFMSPPSHDGSGTCLLKEDVSVKLPDDALIILGSTLVLGDINSPWGLYSTLLRGVPAMTSMPCMLLDRHRCGLGGG